MSVQSLNNIHTALYELQVKSQELVKEVGYMLENNISIHSDRWKMIAKMDVSNLCVGYGKAVRMIEELVE